MTTIEDIYTLDDYRVEVSAGKYSPKKRATMHTVAVYTSQGEYPIARGQSVSAKRSYTNRKAIEVLEKQAGVYL